MGPLDAQLVRRARPVRALLCVDAVIGLVTALCVLVQATLLARVVAGSFAGRPASSAVRPLVALVAVFGVRALLAWGFEVGGRVAAARVLSELRLGLARGRLTANPAALDGAESAELATAAVMGAVPLEAYFGRFLPQMVLAVLVPLAVIGWVAWLDPLSAGIMLLTLPLVPVFMILIGRQTQRRTRERWQALSLLGSHFMDVVRGLPTLRAYNRERVQAARITEASDRYRQATMATLRVAFLSGAVLELAATLGVALVAVTVGVRLDRGGLGLQVALTVLILAPELYLPWRNLAAQYHASADGAAVAERLLPLAQPPRAHRRPRRVAPDPRTAAIELADVRYAYPARPGDVLHGLDLELAAGETVALVGPSGSGKSTVAALLLALTAPASGRIAVGGADLAECDPELWRRSTAWVPQRPTMFRGTIEDNIRLGAPAVSSRRVRAAARLAQADGFVCSLPDGYGTVVGDGGRALSSGQRQRIALARALVRDAGLLVLDEPTAHLDGPTADAVARAIERVARDRTVLVIAHRPEIARAGRVVRLEAGRVVVPAAPAVPV